MESSHIKITDETIDKWIACSKEATRGEWKPNTQSWLGPDKEDDLSAGTGPMCIYGKAFPDAKHIANACPQNFVTILEELKQLRSLANFEIWDAANGHKRNDTSIEEIKKRVQKIKDGK